MTTQREKHNEGNMAVEKGESSNAGTDEYEDNTQEEGKTDGEEVTSGHSITLRQMKL